MLMLPNSSRWLFAAYIAAFVGFWSLGIAGSLPITQVKQANQNQNATHNANPNRGDDDAWWHYSGAWSAIFSFVLTVSTVGLWYYTWRSANAAGAAARAAEKQANVSERALTELETPFVYPEITDETFQQLGIVFRPFELYDHESNNVGPVTPRIAFQLKNHGRTPALLQFVSAVVFVGYPGDNHHDNLAGPIGEPMLGPGATTARRFNRQCVTPVSKEVYEAIRSRTGHVYLRGNTVFADIFGNIFKQHFCLAWDKDARDFVLADPRRNARKRVMNAN